jgi:ribonuclease HI
MSFYAVAKGKQIGIFSTWDECKQQTSGFTGAVFKKFTTKAEAEQFILEKTIFNKTGFNKTGIKETGIKETGIKETPNKKPPRNVITQIEDSAFQPDYYVYTDGSCSDNGKATAAAGIGIYFGENDSRNVSQRVAGKQTNNTAELGAIIHLYGIIKPDIDQGKKIAIVSDSEYAIRCVTTYGQKCADVDWKMAIPNIELVKTAYELYRDKPNVKFLHIMAHTDNTDIHSIGNDGADRLANKAIGLTECPYNQTVKQARLYLSVQFSQKDTVKDLGGRWDAAKKLWYIMEDSENKQQALSLFKQVN